MDQKTEIESWGRVLKVPHEVAELHWMPQSLPALEHAHSYLPFGEGRSYGDSCLNDSGLLLKSRKMNRFIAFDAVTGVLRCEAGIRLDEILNMTIPQGWFLPVVPGTQFVTLGGAIANDIHGKNHHVAGTFGRFVKQLCLLRSDGQQHLCSPSQNSELFGATIGGLGLTGLILWAEIQMKPIQSSFIDQETIRYSSLDEFFKLSKASEITHEYTVAWVDALASGRQLGRGHFIRGNHSQKPGQIKTKNLKVSIPVELPSWVLSQATVHCFNTIYYHRQMKKEQAKHIDYRPFFFPLDSIKKWNRLYGNRGFYQYQVVVPFENNQEPIREILKEVAKSKKASFLAVLKTFGNVPSPGWLSFPRPGVTLALDFPNQGASTLQLFRTLDAIVRQARGALYPAKDATMTAEDFELYYPRWREFQAWIDPQFSSNFWRRVKPGAEKNG